MNQPYHFYAVVLPGLEAMAVQELTHLSAHAIREDEGGVHFSGTLDTLYRVSLRSRCITRVLLRVGKCHAMSLPELEHHVAGMQWEHYIPQGATITVKVSSEHSKLIHSEHISEATLSGIRKTLGKRLLKEGRSQQVVYIHIKNNRCDIRMDTSGERLDRRGYRLQSAKAPIRETLAAGILQWMAWQPEELLYVPMCGSGTFAIEAALMGAMMAPNMKHAFPFQDWDLFKLKRWQRVVEKTEGMVKDPVGMKIHASDLNEGALSAAQANAERAAVRQRLELSKQDIQTLQPEVEEQGLIVCNPPYGIRIESEGEAFYTMLGQLLRKNFHGWRVVVICPSWKHERALAMPVRRRLKVRHGGLWLDVLDVSSNIVEAYQR